jgi:flagellar export protein FliJ
VKRFHFTLATVLEFRRRQVELEEAKLQPLLIELRTLELESGRLESEAVETRRRLMVTGAAESQDLARSDRYLRHLAAENKRHAAKIADCQARTAKQEQAIVEARRCLRLMEKLEERQFREWKAAIEREQENLSSELYLARWKRS